jgi:hypothetical protein
MLEFFFDVVSLWLGTGSQENLRVFLYSRFLYAVLFPLAAWDVFEEVKTQVGKLRRLALARLVSGLFFASVFGFVASLFVGSEDTNAEPTLLATSGLIIWAGSSTATLVFLWSLHRLMRGNRIDTPNNTHVWLVFYELSLIGELLSCLAFLVVPFLKAPSSDILNVLFLAYGIGVTSWCIWKLKALPSGVASSPENASA